jgi:hypothetical protein
VWLFGHCHIQTHVNITGARSYMFTSPGMCETLLKSFSHNFLQKKIKVEKREHADKGTYLFVFFLMDWLLQYVYSLHAGFFLHQKIKLT